jgi:quinoprotein glucose dehydrogenase
MTVGVDWPAYGGTHAAQRYSSLAQINRDNVSQLERAWEYRTGDLPAERWRHDPGVADENIPYTAACRGVAYFASTGTKAPGMMSMTSPPTIVRGIVVVGHQILDGERRDAPSGVIQGFDAITGELRWAWDMGRPDQSGMPPEGETYIRAAPPTCGRSPRATNSLGWSICPWAIPRRTATAAPGHRRRTSTRARWSPLM